MKNVRQFALLLAVTIASLFFFACAKPCNELRDIGCERTGATSKQCAELTEMADRASLEDGRACTRALEIVNSLSKNK